MFLCESARLRPRPSCPNHTCGPVLVTLYLPSRWSWFYLIGNTEVSVIGVLYLSQRASVPLARGILYYPD